jgi:pimeloyl-ACP methyl ester carboxylesterase
MNRLYRVQCCLFGCLLMVQSDDLLARYGDEIRSVFREQLSDAWQAGPTAILRVWSGILAETIALTTPRYAARLRLLLAAGVLASGLTIGTALGFCTIGPSPLVHACPHQEPTLQGSPQAGTSGGLIELPDGHRMFLKCSGGPNVAPTVILATGRGLGTAEAWALVQNKVPPSIRVCSYDAIGAGRSDRAQESHAIDQVVSEMHDLFTTARLKQPYVLVGISAGGVLVRRYQQKYAREVGGLVFVDSAHEEMEWRDAAISKQFDPDWNNPVSLRENGLLSQDQRLAWHVDIPLVVLERTDLPPCSAFPGLNQQQCDAINAEWHNLQVDLARRSRYGQLRSVAGSGHFMQQQRPDAIADAIRDVVKQVLSPVAQRTRAGGNTMSRNIHRSLLQL